MLTLSPGDTVLAAHRHYPKQRREAGVYGIRCSVTGKWYVGSSIKLSVRLQHHRWALRLGRHHSLKLQRAYNKYGNDAFEFKVLLFCDQENVEFFEQRAIDTLNSVVHGYNVAAHPKGGFMRGRTWPEATKAARIEAMKALGVSADTRKRMQEGLDAMTPEAKRLQRERIGDANRRPLSPAARDAVATANRRRLNDPAPEQVESRRRNVLKGHATRRAKKLQDELKNKLHASASEEVLYGRN